MKNTSAQPVFSFTCSLLHLFTRHFSLFTFHSSLFTRSLDHPGSPATGLRRWGGHHPGSPATGRRWGGHHSITSSLHHSHFLCTVHSPLCDKSHWRKKRAIFARNPHKPKKNLFFFFFAFECDLSHPRKRRPSGLPPNRPVDDFEALKIVCDAHHHRSVGAGL